MQTTRVLRRILAMSAAHAGWPGPAFPRLASFRTWCTSTLPGSPHSSHRSSAAAPLTAAEWAELSIPVSIAFFFLNSAIGHVVARWRAGGVHVER